MWHESFYQGLKRLTNMLLHQPETAKAIKGHKLRSINQLSAMIKVAVVGGIAFLLIMMGVVVNMSLGSNGDANTGKQVMEATKCSSAMSVEQSSPVLLMNTTPMQRVASMIHSHPKIAIGVVMMVVLLVVIAIVVLVVVVPSLSDEEADISPSIPSSPANQDQSDRTIDDGKVLIEKEEHWWKKYPGLVIGGSIASGVLFAVAIVLVVLQQKNIINLPCKGSCQRGLNVPNIASIHDYSNDPDVVKIHDTGDSELRNKLLASYGQLLFVDNVTTATSKELENSIDENMKLVRSMALHKRCVPHENLVYAKIFIPGHESKKVLIASEDLVAVYVGLANSSIANVEEYYFVTSPNNELTLESYLVKGDNECNVVTVKSQLDYWKSNLEVLRKLYCYVCKLLVELDKKK